MSAVEQAINGMADLLETELVAPPTIPTRIYRNPAEAVNLADFPCLVFGLAPLPERHVYGRETIGEQAHEFKLALWAFVGSRQTGLPELHGRILPWPAAIGHALVTDKTLGGVVAFIGENRGSLWQYEIGAYEWGSGVYFGLYGVIPVTVYCDF